MKKTFLTILIFFSVFSQISFAQDSLQKSQPFLPDVISQFPSVRDLAISSAEDEIYFTVQSHLGELSSIVHLRKENNNWSKPEVALFSGRYSDLEPFLSPDGLKLYFVSNRPVDNKTNEAKDYDIWFVERKNAQSGWSEPINIGAPINTKGNEFYPSISKSSNLYFTTDGANSKGKDDIFVSKWKDGKYEAPQSMGDSVNTPGYEFNAFISADESYLLYTGYNRKEGIGSGDIYISYNKGNDQWTTSKSLGAGINSMQMDYCPFVNEKSGTLYFTSKRSFVNSLFDKNQNMNEVLKELNKYENGQSRLYQVPFKPDVKQNTKKSTK